MEFLHAFCGVGKKTNKKGTWVKGAPRTLKNIVQNYEDWVSQTGSNRNLLRNNFNAEFPPVHIIEDQETL